MNEPTWLTVARSHIGQAEKPGPASNDWIRAMWARLKGGKWFWDAIGKGDDSKLPWCGAFVALCLDESGIEYAKDYASAKAWLNWGTSMSAPAIGCVVVFSREGGGHVGFVVGRTVRGNLLVLGGNQGDAVRLSEFPLSRVAGYRWPKVAFPQPLVSLSDLPVVSFAGGISTNEA